MTRAELQAAVDRIPHWAHALDLGHGVLTPGMKGPEVLAAQWADLEVDVSGCSVLDVGAGDGWFSFEAERRGAARVVALDGRPRHGFELAHATLGSAVQPVAGELADIGDALGTFDIVLVLGVLCRVTDPLTLLRHVRARTAGQAIIETEAIVLPDCETVPLARLVLGDERDIDPANHWVPNLAGLMALCVKAGFTAAEPVRKPDGLVVPRRGRPAHYRAVVRATVA